MFTLLLLLALAQAPAFQTDRLGWDLVGVTDPTGYSFVYTLDGGAKTPLQDAVCAPTAVPLCQAPFPAMAPGQHRLVLYSRLSGAESAGSPELLFTMTVVVAPSGVRVIKGV